MATINSFARLLASSYLGITAITVTAVTETPVFSALLDLDVDTSNPDYRRHPSSEVRPSGSAPTWCEDCQRPSYESRAQGRAARRRHGPRKGIAVVSCPHRAHSWHLDRRVTPTPDRPAERDWSAATQRPLTTPTLVAAVWKAAA